MGALKVSPQMEHEKEESNCRRPGALSSAGKSVGPGTFSILQVGKALMGRRKQKAASSIGGESNSENALPSHVTVAQQSPVTLLMATLVLIKGGIYPYRKHS